MAKRKLGHGTESSAKNISKSSRKFHIPPLLKTKQIEVEVKPEIDTPCTDSKSSITSNNILITCSGCGRPGTHHFGLGYRLVKTALLVEVGTQTGDENSVSETQLEDSIPSTSSTTPIIVSSDNGKILSSHYHLLCSRFIHASHPLYTVSFDQFHLFQMTIPQMMMIVQTKMIV